MAIFGAGALHQEEHQLPVDESLQRFDEILKAARAAGISVGVSLARRASLLSSEHSGTGQPLTSAASLTGSLSWVQGARAPHPEVFSQVNGVRRNPGKCFLQTCSGSFAPPRPGRTGSNRAGGGTSGTLAPPLARHTSLRNPLGL